MRISKEEPAGGFGCVFEIQRKTLPGEWVHLRGSDNFLEWLTAYIAIEHHDYFDHRSIQLPLVQNLFYKFGVDR